MITVRDTAITFIGDWGLVIGNLSLGIEVAMNQANEIENRLIDFAV